MGRARPALIDLGVHLRDSVDYLGVDGGIVNLDGGHQLREQVQSRRYPLYRLDTWCQLGNGIRAFGFSIQTIQLGEVREKRLRTAQEFDGLLTQSSLDVTERLIELVDSREIDIPILADSGQMTTLGTIRCLCSGKISQGHGGLPDRE